MNAFFFFKSISTVTSDEYISNSKPIENFTWNFFIAYTELDVFDSYSKRSFDCCKLVSKNKKNLILLLKNNRLKTNNFFSVLLFFRFIMLKGCNADAVLKDADQQFKDYGSINITENFTNNRKKNANKCWKIFFFYPLFLLSFFFSVVDFYPFSFVSIIIVNSVQHMSTIRLNHESVSKDWKILVICLLPLIPVWYYWILLRFWKNSILNCYKRWVLTVLRI